MQCSACELKANDHVDDSTNQMTCPWEFPDVHIGRTAGTGSQGHGRLLQYIRLVDVRQSPEAKVAQSCMCTLEIIQRYCKC